MQTEPFHTWRTSPGTMRMCVCVCGRCPCSADGWCCLNYMNWILLFMLCERKENSKEKKKHKKTKIYKHIHTLVCDDVKQMRTMLEQEQKKKPLPLKTWKIEQNVEIMLKPFKLIVVEKRKRVSRKSHIHWMKLGKIKPFQLIIWALDMCFCICMSAPHFQLLSRNHVNENNVIIYSKLLEKEARWCILHLRNKTNLLYSHTSECS